MAKIIHRIGAKSIKFDLKVKNYNDLVYRRTLTDKIPLVLIIIVLPEDNSKWIALDSTKMIMACEIYWFYPSNAVTLSENKKTVRVRIPQNNQARIDIFPNLFNLFFG